MEGECPHYEDDFWRRADSAASGWTRIHETRTGPTDSIMRDFTYRTRRPLPADPQPVGQRSETPERNGSFLDKWGACKVCDGEIPHGHAAHCDIYKLEQEIASLRTALATVTAERDALKGTK